MLFILGFLLFIAGFAMVVIGSFPWFGGRRIPAGPARLAGAIFLCFFPLVFSVRFLIKRLELDVNPTPIHWCVAVFCILVGMVILFRAIPKGGSSTRRYGQVSNTPFQDETQGLSSVPVSQSNRKVPNTSPVETSRSQEAPPWQVPEVPKPARKERPVEKNPFDFS